MSAESTAIATCVPASAAERETHGSLVRLHGDRAYKLRKPVHFAFLDQSTAERRAALAEAEVALNQELAPDTYLGTRPVTITADGTWRVGDEPPAAGDEVVVVMRRFAETDTLAARLSSGRVRTEQLRELGMTLARFHAAAPSAGGGVQAALARVDRNVEELAALLGHGIDGPELWRMARPLTAYALRNAELLDARARRGRWREGHGDLRADHVVIDDRGLRIVDRLEFDRGLRVDDVASDLAFLLMDLERRDAGWAADEVLAGYRAAGGDPGDDHLLAFWGAYRAGVSAKVALLRAQQPGGASALEQARGNLALAVRLAGRTRPSLVLVVCGPPASGKSTLAALLHIRSGLPVVSSDLLRKAMHGVRRTDQAPASAYSAAASLAVYREVGQRAAGALAFHGGAIVDATMSTAAERAIFLDGLGSGARAVFVECRVPARLALARARERLDDPEAVSDATPAIAARMRDVWEPPDEIPGDDHVAVRADRDAELVVDDVERLLDEVRR